MYSIINSIDDIVKHYENEGWTEKPVLQGTRLVAPERIGQGYLDFLGDIGTCYFIRADYQYREDYIVRYILKERYIEISWTAASEVIAYQSKKKLFPIEAGLNIYVNAHPLQIFGRVPADTAVSYCSILIRESFLVQHNINLPASFWEAGVRIFNPDVISHPVLSALIQQTAKIEINEKAFRIFLQGTAIQALALLVQYIEQQEENGMSKPLSETALQAVIMCKETIDRNYKNPPVIQALCKSAGINKNKLQQGFRQLTGLSVSEYLRSKRMEKAVALLEAGNLRVEDIAVSVGYQSPVNFYKAFEKSFGLTPRHMRILLTGK